MGCRRAYVKYMYVMKENSNCEVRALQRSTFFSLKIVCVQNVLWILSHIHHSTATPERNECANTEHAFHVTFDSFASLQHNQNDKSTVYAERCEALETIRMNEFVCAFFIVDSILSERAIYSPRKKKESYIDCVRCALMCFETTNTANRCRILFTGPINGPMS